MGPVFIAVFLIASGILFVLIYGSTRYKAWIENGVLTIQSSFLGIPGWTYRCILSDIEWHKYPATIFDMGPIGGHVWGAPWSAHGIVFRFAKPWWLFRRAFLYCPNVAELASDLQRLRSGPND